MKEKHKDRLFDNRLKKIENRLRRIEVLLLKSGLTRKRMKKGLKLLESEEEIIEKEQKKLEDNEKAILHEVKKIEKEEKWNIEIRFNCHYKDIGSDGTTKCHKTGKLCSLSTCPLVKK